MKRESATFTAEFWTFPASINLCSTIKINVKPSEITWHVSSSRKVKKDLLNPHRKLKLIEEFSRFSKVLLLQFLFKYCNIKVELLRTNWVIEVEVYFFFTKSCITLKWNSFLKNGRFGLLRRIDLTLRLTAKPNRKKSLVLRNWKMILQSSSTFFFKYLQPHLQHPISINSLGKWRLKPWALRANGGRLCHFLASSDDHLKISNNSFKLFKIRYSR